MTQEQKDNLLSELASLMRFAIRLNNTHPELVNESVIYSIEKSKIIIKNNYNSNEPNIAQQSNSYTRDCVLASLEKASDSIDWNWADFETIEEIKKSIINESNILLL